MMNQPTTFRALVLQVHAACGGIPCRATPQGLALGLIAIESITAHERAMCANALAHWALACAFAHVDDVTRSIAMRPELHASRGDA